MGRKKPGKPRRHRIATGAARQYTLEELQPPGDAYDEWYTIRPGMNPAEITDPRLDADARNLMDRLARLAPLYDGKVPKAALLLDNIIDTGNLPIIEGSNAGILVPIEEMAALQGDTSHDSVRQSIHNLHAIGALLVMTDDEHGVSYVRMVAKRPDRPGDQWRFAGDPDAVSATTCIPNAIWQELPVDVAAAVAFMRVSKGRLEEPDPAVYGTHQGVNGTEHARELFAAALASGYVDEKGCEACPVGHLCMQTG